MQLDLNDVTACAPLPPLLWGRLVWVTESSRKALRSPDPSAVTFPREVLISPLTLPRESRCPPFKFFAEAHGSPKAFSLPRRLTEEL